MKSSNKLEVGGWTPGLRQMGLDLLDKLILRPSSLVISDPRRGVNTFQGIREKLSRKKYNSVEEWKNDVLSVFLSAEASNNPLIDDICADLRQKFLKHYQLIEQLATFHFRDAVQDVANELHQIVSQ